MATPNELPESSFSDGATWVQKGLNLSRYGIKRVQARLGKRGLIVLGSAVIVGGLALNWSWLVAIGLAPLLLTILPCAVMCALGVCMMPKSEKPRNGDPMATVGHAENSRPTMVGSQSDRNL